MREIEKGIDSYFVISQEKQHQEAGVAEEKISKIPMDVGYLNIEGSSELMPSNEKYHHLIGTLLYLSINTRPDVSTAVLILTLSEASQEAIWLRRFMNDFEIKTNDARMIY